MGFVKTNPNACKPPFNSIMAINQYPKEEIPKILIDRVLKSYPKWNENIPPAVNPVSLKNVNLSAKEVAQLPLTDIQKGVLFGTIFGDTSININKNYKNARLQARHSTRQVEWFLWKYSVALGQFHNIPSGVVFQQPDGYQRRSKPLPGEDILGKLKIASKAHPTLTSVLKIVGVGGKKTIQRFWLNHMNSYFLMTIFLDNGGLNISEGRFFDKNHRFLSKSVFCLTGLGKDQMVIFIDYMLKVWDIRCELIDLNFDMQDGRPAYRIRIKTVDLFKFYRIIAPIIPVKEMVYKVCYFSNGNADHVKRWSSELKTLVKPEFAGFVDDFYRKKFKKLNWVY